MLRRWLELYVQLFFFSSLWVTVSSGEVKGRGPKLFQISNVHFLLCSIRKDFADSSSGVLGGAGRGGCHTGDQHRMAAVLS